MQIAVIAKKGGVGKTTLCILLHEAIRQTEQRVAVRDFDAQGSATKALRRFGGTPEVHGEKYDVVFIDSPLFDNERDSGSCFRGEYNPHPNESFASRCLGGGRNGGLRARQKMQ